MKDDEIYQKACRVAESAKTIDQGLGAVRYIENALRGSLKPITRKHLQELLWALQDTYINE